MSDTISRLQKYAHLVLDKYKVQLTPKVNGVDRYCFSITGLKILRDHPSIESELRDDLCDFIAALESDQG